MQQSSKNVFTDPQSWEQFIGDPPKSKQSLTVPMDFSSPKYIPTINAEPRMMEVQMQNQNQVIKSPSSTMDPQGPDNELLFKRIYDKNLIKNQEEYFSEDKLPENSFKRQQVKASLYSKNYREKKKQKVKKLEEENDFLKKKIDELQVRLREKELELSRIKFSLTQQQWTIQQINQEMMKKLTLISDVTIDENSKLKAEKKHEQTDNEKKIKEWLGFYQDHGFGGRKKKEVLQYYVNEFLQNVMRDREKYLIVNCVKERYMSQETTLFDDEIAEVLMNNTEESRLKSIKFNDFIRPACLQLVEACRNFYTSYKKVLTKIQRIHDQTKLLSMKNIEQTMKRSRGAAWFQANQYRKEMRNLRAEWIDLVKSQSDIQMHEDKTRMKPAAKRKKTLDE